MVDLDEELPSPDAVVAPMVSDGQLPQVHILQGRLWACEWSGQPPTVQEVMVDGKTARSSRPGIDRAFAPFRARRGPGFTGP